MTEEPIQAHPNCPEDLDILNGIHQKGSQRDKAIMTMFESFSYFVKFGQGKYRLSEENAQTAYNESILACINAIERKKFKGESCLKTYLHTIFRNKCVNEIRSNKSNQANESLEDFVHIPDKAKSILHQMDLESRLAETLALLDKIGKKCKEVLLQTARGYSSSEIAVMLGYKDDNTVNVIRRRCRASLLKQMG
ncbi:MAG: sigma-70 family RNA polymerase sigma factor [Bacteroidia bacterium]|nr:sigma-70 family RNA polymerase sigma factor [Bacteroidia bacterium]